jgi:hypothetical protein
MLAFTPMQPPRFTRHESSVRGRRGYEADEIANAEDSLPNLGGYKVHRSNA